MQELTSVGLEDIKIQLQNIVKPYQQEQSKRQKKTDFFKKCMKSIEKKDFFTLDELLKAAVARNILEDPFFKPCHPIFSELKMFANEKIDRYRSEIKEDLLRLAEAYELPFYMDLPHFSVLKGIEGKLDFTNKATKINHVLLKSIDPKRIISAVIKIKKKLYDRPFEPQHFIDSLFDCYKKIIKESEEKNIVPIRRLYSEYVWSLQSKTFFQNMEKGKFRGYGVEQFAVDIWRFFESDIHTTTSGYRIRLNAGRGSSLWLIDQDGEKRQITHSLFIKS